MNNIYLHAGFETGDLSEAYSSIGNISVVSDIVHEDGYAARASGAASSTAYMMLRTRNLDNGGGGNLTMAPLTAVLRLYIYFPALPTSAYCDFMNVVGAGSKARLRLFSDGRVGILGSSTTTVYATSQTQLAPGQWHLIEYLLTTPPDAPTPTPFTLMLNRSEVLKADVATVVQANFQFQLGKLTSAGAMVFYYDDIMVTDAWANPGHTTPCPFVEDYERVGDTMAYYMDTPAPELAAWEVLTNNDANVGYMVASSSGSLASVWFDTSPIGNRQINAQTALVNVRGSGTTTAFDLLYATALSGGGVSPYYTGTSGVNIANAWTRMAKSFSQNPATQLPWERGQGNAAAVGFRAGLSDFHACTYATLMVDSVDVSTGSGAMPLFMAGHLPASGGLDLTTLAHEVASGVLDTRVAGFMVARGALDATVTGVISASGSIDLTSLAHDSIAGDRSLFIWGHGETNKALPLYIRVVGGEPTAPGEPVPTTGELPLVLPFPHAVATGLLPLYVVGPVGFVSGSLSAIVFGFSPKDGPACPTRDSTASIQITDELVSIYQGRIDALINQLGKNILLEFDPERVICPNCEYDPVHQRSTGVFKIGGPVPFSRGHQCPYCKGVGATLVPVTRCIKALIKWDPEDALNYGITVSDARAVVRTKAMLRDLPEIARAKSALMNYSIKNILRLRCRLLQAPVPVGLRDSRYCIAFWELVENA